MQCPSLCVFKAALEEQLDKKLLGKKTTSVLELKSVNLSLISFLTLRKEKR